MQMDNHVPEQAVAEFFARAAGWFFGMGLAQSHADAWCVMSVHWQIDWRSGRQAVPALNALAMQKQITITHR